MHNLPTASRKRPVTACTECRRRKQKCDREKPCGLCTGRGIPDRCTFDYPESSDERSTPQAELSGLQSPFLTPHGDQFSSLPMDQQLENQIGYARSSEVNFLSDLCRLVGDDSELRALPFTPTTMPLPLPTFQHLSGFYSKIPPRPVTRELIEIYFSEANWYFGVLEKYFFEKLYNSWCAFNDHGIANGHFGGLSNDLLHFPALLLQVFAVALQFAPLSMPCMQALGVDGFSRRDSLSSDFSSWGMEIIRVVGRGDPAITTVQNDLMRALWLKNCSRGREAWHVLGGAIRMAQDLGLHQQSQVVQSPNSSLEETLSKMWYDEYKRRLWIKLFSWDSHMAFSLGRPRAINSSDCTAVLPLDCDIPENPPKTIPMAVLAHERPSSFTPHLFHYAVCQLIHEAMSLGVQRRHLEDYALVDALHDRILSLLSGLPPAVRPVNPNTSWDSSHPHIPKKRQQIATTAHSFIMALHKPHSKIRVASRDAAIEAAISTLDAQERLFDLMATRYYNIYALSVYTVDAATFLSVTTLEHPPSDPSTLHRIYHVIEKAILRLELSRERVSLATSALQILKPCYLKMRPFSELQLHTPSLTVQPPSQIVNSTPSDETHIGDLPSNFSQEIFHLPDPNAMSMFDHDQLDSTTMFDEVITSNFDVESWVRNMNKTNGMNRE